ncbi:MAG: hypothetical protein MJ144_04500 [Clostridia bacterium]|nr:hypothetical protein [Clostridia bacterium]
MIRGFRDYIRKSIEADEKRLENYRRLANTKAEGRLNIRTDKRWGRIYYYLKEQGEKKEKYVKEGPNAKVWKLQRKRFAQEMIKILEANIYIKKELCERLLDDSPTAAMDRMPRAYRPNSKFKPISRSKKKVKQSENPYKREQLKETTSFGLLVRTKGELLIAELLHALGVEFYYEKALRLRIPMKEIVHVNGKKVVETYWINKTYYPDFTIVLPDGSEVYWEHKGMLSDEGYVERDMQREIHYNLCGIYQPHNLMVTAEGPENDMDMEAVNRIVEGWLMPLLNM